MIFIPFFVAPLAAGAAAEYAVCRFPKKRIWRYLPPILSAGAVLAVSLFRYHGWDQAGSQGAPLDTLLFFPGLPALGMALGLFLGWRLYKHLWTPRIVKKKKPGEE